MCQLITIITRELLHVVRVTQLDLDGNISQSDRPVIYFRQLWCSTLCILCLAFRFFVYFFLFVLSLVISNSAANCLERLVFEMTHCVYSRTKLYSLDRSLCANYLEHCIPSELRLVDTYPVLSTSKVIPVSSFNLHRADLAATN